jgi:hypothetical protein
LEERERAVFVEEVGLQYFSHQQIVSGYICPPRRVQSFDPRLDQFGSAERHQVRHQSLILYWVLLLAPPEERLLGPVVDDGVEVFVVDGQVWHLLAVREAKAMPRLRANADPQQPIAGLNQSQDGLRAATIANVVKNLGGLGGGPRLYGVEDCVGGARLVELVALLFD